MTDAAREDLASDSHWNRILADYRGRVSSGEDVDDEKFVAQHPEYADALRSWIATSSRPQIPALYEPTDSLHSTGYRPMSNQETIPPEQKTRQATAEPLPEQFGRYRIIRCLGQGAMGAVYLAHDTQLDREVAIKIPKFAAGDSLEFVQRFYREAQSAALLRHANVCPVYDVGEIDGRHYLSMAYIEGRLLAEVIKSGRKMSEAEAVEIVLKLARATANAHGEGVIHRDLKPANIMIDDHGEPIIMDFGLARRLNHEDARLTQAGLVVGSPAYMSPEQVEGDLDVMGVGCDIYSLGVIFYELLTGEIPFKGSIAAVMGQIVTQAPKKPTSVRPGIDPRLEAICLKMMEKKVSDRYATMRDVATALANYKSGSMPTPSSGPTADAAHGRSDDYAPRITLRPWMVWTAIIVIVAGFGLTWWMVARIFESMNNQAGVAGSAKQVIDQKGYSVYIDGRQIPETEFSAPIILPEGTHVVEIRDGDTVISDIEPYVVPPGEKMKLKIREHKGNFFVEGDKVDDAPPPPEPAEKKTAEAETAPATSENASENAAPAKTDAP